MQVKTVKYEWFQDYKKPSMFVAFPLCNFKCERECGDRVCQNSTLVKAPNVRVIDFELIDQYFENPITKAIVCGGLEPMDSFEEIVHLIDKLRARGCDDDVVIYTGYTEEECSKARWLHVLSGYKNIIIKFGRFVPNQKPHYDPVLGVNLASDNQYGKVIS